MKTAGRENQKRCLNRAASRDHGTEGQNNPVQWGGLDGKKTSGRRRSLFSLTPFIELIRSWPQSRRHSAIGLLSGRNLRLCSWLLRWRFRLRNPQRPRKTERDGASLRTSYSMILIVVFEEGCEILRRKNKIGLNTNCMHGIEWNRELRNSWTQGSAAVRNLPLVVPNEAELEQPAEVFLQGKNLPKSPLNGESLTRCNVRAAFLPVDFPVSGQVRGGSLVLGDVESRAARYVVAPVAGTYIVGRSRCESAGRSCESVSDVEVRSLQVPTKVKRLDVHVGKTCPSSAGAEVSPSDVGYHLTACVVECDVGHEISPKDLVLGNVVDNVFIHPERIVAGNTGNAVSASVIQLTSRVVQRQVGIGEARIRNHTSV